VELVNQVKETTAVQVFGATLTQVVVVEVLVLLVVIQIQPTRRLQAMVVME
jgi:hypothetical protein